MENVTRRKVLWGLGGLLVLPVFAGEAEAAEWIAVGKPTDFKPRVPKKITLKSGAVIYVVREAAAAYTAVSAVCTHQGCQVNWDQGEQKYLCPCHGAVFSHSGQVLKGPAKRPLPNFPVAVKNGEVLVNAGTAPKPAPKKK